MKKSHQDAIDRQHYTPKFVPGVCGNCVHMRCDLELPAWMKRQSRVWDDKYKQEKNHRCNIGHFPVKKNGSCAEHAFLDQVGSA